MKNTTELFAEYCDVVSVDDVTKMLKLSKVTVYKLLKSAKSELLKLARDTLSQRDVFRNFLKAVR